MQMKMQTLIVLTAVKSEGTMNTVLVGDDTDLLVLLRYHGNLASHKLFFKLEPKKDEKSERVEHKGIERHS